MRVTPRLLTSGGSTSDHHTFFTNSISPLAHKLITVMTFSRVGAGIFTPNAPIITGAGLTWTIVGSSVHPSPGVHHVNLLRAVTPASPSSGALTINFSGQPQQHCHWSVVEWSAIRLGGVNGALAVPQHKAGYANTGAGSMSITLNDTISDPDSAIYAGMIAIGPLTTFASAYGETPLSDVQVNDGPTSTHSQDHWRRGVNKTTGWTFSTQQIEPVGLAAEIRALPTGGLLLNLL